MEDYEDDYYHDESEEEEDEDNELGYAMTAVGMALGGLVVTTMLLGEWARHSRAYVRKSALLDSLAEITPAKRVLENGDDMAYIRYFSLDRAAFDDLHSLFAAKEAARAARIGIQATGRRPCLDSRQRLALCLYYLVSPARQMDIVLVFGLTPATLSRTLWTSMSVLDK